MGRGEGQLRVELQRVGRSLTALRTIHSTTSANCSVRVSAIREKVEAKDEIGRRAGEPGWAQVEAIEGSSLILLLSSTGEMA